MTATIVTPTVGRTVKRSLFWVGVVGVALIVAVLMMVMAMPLNLHFPFATSADSTHAYSTSSSFILISSPLVICT